MEPQETKEMNRQNSYSMTHFTQILQQMLKNTFVYIDIEQIH